MAYAYRYHANTGPTRLNRTSWGPVSAPAPIEIPNKMFSRPLSGNFDRIINSFDRTNAFECVRSAFEQASCKTPKEVSFQSGEKSHADGGLFQKQVEENEKKDRFVGHSDMIVNGRGCENLSSSFERAGVGLACRKTPCDEEVSEYYQDRFYVSQARQLFPLQEDLADWINKTIGITYLTGENFLEVLDNGVELCQLATIIRDKAKEAADKGLYDGKIPHVRGKCWQRAARRSFFSRDNMDNFITFCRQLGVHENLLFESDDLVLHAQPRNVIVCLLEVARIATKWSVEPPGLVQLEREIALEEAGAGTEGPLGAALGWQFQPSKEEENSKGKIDPPPSPIETEVSLPAALFSAELEDTPSVHTDDTWSRGTPEDPDCVPVKPLSDLDKRVQIATRLMQRNCNCSEGKCSKLLKVKKVGEGRYNIAGRNVFIRLLKGRHMMVRVGGGWDTLEHFLTRHDPCQVRVISPQSSTHRVTVNLLHQAQLASSSADSVCTSDNASISNGDISPAELNASETSSINGNISPNIAKKSNGKVSPSSRKSSVASISPMNNSKPSTGRNTPQSNGKISPNLKSPLNGKVVATRSNGKISPSNLKLDLALLNNNNVSLKSLGIVNNRMISPIESSSRLLPADPKSPLQNGRTLRTPTSEGRKSLPSAGCTPDTAARRRSLNLSLPSANAKTTKSPSHVRSQSLKSPINNKSFLTDKRNSLQSPVGNRPLISPSSIERSIRMAVPLQSSTPNKPFLHIRAKYRSPPPRDVPPR